MAPTPSPRARTRRHSGIPDDVLRHHVLPRLPFKQIARLRTLSKAYRTLLTDDPKFAADQARLCPPTFALIRILGSGLELLSSTPATVGIPSASLDFLDCAAGMHVNLLASTNGLLCVRCFYYWSPDPTRMYFIANPATRQAQQIPGITTGVPLGLAFDPSVDAHKFSIVQPVRSVIAGRAEFRFVVFSSDTGRWTAPDTRVTTNRRGCPPTKASYAAGVLYFDHEVFILWFDVATTAAGAINMPWSFSPRVNRLWCTEASADGQRLLCTTSDKNALTVYHLVKTDMRIHHWEVKHRKTWGEMITVSEHAFRFCFSMKLRSGRRQVERLAQWTVRPIWVENDRWVYVTATPSWNDKNRALRYDMVTGETTDVSNLLERFYRVSGTFRYRNSMAAIPPIATLALATQDGNL